MLYNLNFLQAADLLSQNESSWSEPCQADSSWAELSQVKLSLADSNQIMLSP